MKTTLNLPNVLVSQAKIKAVQEKTTLTALIIQGLEIRLKKGPIPGDLPVSKATGGLLPGIEWSDLHRLGEGNEAFR